MIRLLWGLTVLSAAAVIGAAVAADLLIHAPSSLILRTWRQRRKDRYDEYRLGAYTEDAVSTALAAAGAEASAGCPCEGCDRIRAAVADSLFRVTADDIAELDRIGITWEAR